MAQKEKQHTCKKGSGKKKRKKKYIKGKGGKNNIENKEELRIPHRRALGPNYTRQKKKKSILN